MQKLEVLARELGATKIDLRINWVWALKFPSMREADQFVKILKEQNEEHRGPHDFGDEDRGIAVGWRVG